MIVDAVLLSAVGVFQALLAIGMPYGEAAWGGQYKGVLPVRLRVGSAISVLLHAAMVFFVLSRDGLAPLDASDGAVKPALWVITALLGLSTLANAASRSPKERVLWTPVAAILLLLTGSLAWSA